MSKINQIQSAILSLDPGAYQKLMDSYIMRKYGFSNIMPLGSHSGTNKTTKGTPDSFIQCEDGRFILVAHGTVGNHAFDKVESDILACLDISKTGIEEKDIAQIICCHTSTNFTPGQIKKLCSHFENTSLIGLGDVSFDLNIKYPDLAKDHLNIDIDTHQIFNVDAFISYASQNPYSTTLDMPILCREQELQDIEAILKSDQAVFLLGPAGVGKTRLALESAKNYAKQQNCELKIIRSNGEPIYQDLITAFPDERNYLILIDDADQLTHLHHLLRISTDPLRQHYIKIIFTVRDYAKEKLLKTVRSALIPAQYEVKTLSDDSISKVLSDNLGIKNEDLLKQIGLIAKGNVRLAIMAGMCAVNGKFESVRNSFDIFNDYYSDVIGDFSRDEILTAGIVAFFDAFHLKETELPFDVALRLGIDTTDFRENCLALHRKEVVSIFDNKAIKFENQNLRDYLLYYIFFKEKWISPSDIICRAFPEYKNRIVFSFNTLISLFNSPENVEFIEKEIRTAWTKMKDQSEAVVFAFIGAFYNVIQDETLMYIKQKIDELPEVHQDLLNYDFSKNSNYHTIRSELIEILIGFKHTERFKDAIQLALYYFERNNSEPMDIYFLFGEKWGVGRLSHKRKYTEEQILLEQLLEYSQKNKSVLSAYCLIFAAEHLLKMKFSATEMNRDNTATFYQFGLLACNELFELRALAIGTLISMTNNSSLRDQAAEAIMEYPSYSESEVDEQIMAHDIAMLPKFFALPLDTDDFLICKILHHFEDICERNKIEWPADLPVSDQNPTYKLYKMLSKNYYHECGARRDAEEYRAEVIRNIAETASERDLACLWELLETESGKSNSHDNWELSSGIEMLFSALSKLDSGKFIHCCEAYINHQTPNWGSRYSVIEPLISVLGYRETIDFVCSHTFRMKYRWLASLHDLVPDEHINTDFCEGVMHCLSGEGNDEHNIISLETVLRIERNQPGFLVRYVFELNKVGETKPYLVSHFMLPVGFRGCIGAKKMVKYFEGNIQILCTAYIHACRGRQYYDHGGEFFLELLRANPDFLLVFVQAIQQNHIGRDERSCFNILWQQEDFLELITVIMEHLKETSQFSFQWNTLAESLLCDQQRDSGIDCRRNEWIAHYIEKNSNDEAAMKFLFGVVCNLPEQHRLPAIVAFCANNPSYENFCNIQLTPTHMSWSGSEVPVIERQIAFLKRLRESLLGIQFIEHRARISAMIQFYQESKERVLLKEFLEDR